MAANPAIQRGAYEGEAQPSPAQRTWANTVPYDRMGAEVIDGRAAAAPAAARPRPLTPPPGAAQRSTGTLYNRPVRPTINLPEIEDWRPAGGASTGRLAAEEHSPLLSRSNARLTLYGLLAAVAVVALYLVVSTVVSWTQLRLDDMQYGNPRTTHLDAIVGNGDSAAAPTHFIAINLNRQVSIIEIP